MMSQKITKGMMLDKLDNMHIEMDSIIDKAKLAMMQKKSSTVIMKLKNEYEQLQEDIELMQLMLMYQSNKDTRS